MMSTVAEVTLFCILHQQMNVYLFPYSISCISGSIDLVVYVGKKAVYILTALVVHQLDDAGGH